MANSPASADEEDSAPQKGSKPRITVLALAKVIKVAIEARPGSVADMVRNKQVFVYDSKVVRHLTTAVAVCQELLGDIYAAGSEGVSPPLITTIVGALFEVNKKLLIYGDADLPLYMDAIILQAFWSRSHSKGRYQRRKSGGMPASSPEAGDPPLEPTSADEENIATATAVPSALVPPAVAAPAPCASTPAVAVAEMECMSPTCSYASQEDVAAAVDDACADEQADIAAAIAASLGDSSSPTSDEGKADRASGMVDFYCVGCRVAKQVHQQFIQDANHVGCECGRILIPCMELQDRAAQGESGSRGSCLSALERSLIPSPVAAAKDLVLVQASSTPAASNAPALLVAAANVFDPGDAHVDAALRGSPADPLAQKKKRKDTSKPKGKAKSTKKPAIADAMSEDLQSTDDLASAESGVEPPPHVVVPAPAKKPNPGLVAWGKFLAEFPNPQNLQGNEKRKAAALAWKVANPRQVGRTGCSKCRWSKKGCTACRAH